VTIREVSQNLARVPKTVWYNSRKSPETDVFAKNKIWTRLVGRPTLVVQSLTLWSVRGGGTVRVTKCVILASIWASKYLLGKKTKRPVNGLERGPSGPKINGNLIKCQLQGFCDNPGGFQKNGPGAEAVCYSSRKSPETDVFAKKIKFEPVWPGDLPWWCYALNYGRYVEKRPLEWRNVSFWLSCEQVIVCKERQRNDP
jgi:hypothetical protein